MASTSATRASLQTGGSALTSRSIVSASSARPSEVRPVARASKSATAASIERREKIGIIGSTPVRKVGSTDSRTKSTVRGSTTRTSSRLGVRVQQLFMTGRRKIW